MKTEYIYKLVQHLASHLSREWYIDSPTIRSELTGLFTMSADDLENDFDPYRLTMAKLTAKQNEKAPAPEPSGTGA